MNEPAVALTDLALAAETAVLALLLLRPGAGRESTGPLWAGMFAALGVAALAGFWVHGPGVPGSRASELVWAVALLGLGLAALASWWIAARLSLAGRVRRAVELASLGVFVLYAGRVAVGGAPFALAAAHSLPATLFLLASVASRARRGEPGYRAATIGLSLGVAAGVLQALRVGLHPEHFDHNALFHVLELAALPLVHQAARRPGRQRATKGSRRVESP